MKAVSNLFERFKPSFEKGGKLESLYPLYEMVETIALTPSTKTHHGAHVRDPMDMKRLMIAVLYALFPAILMGMYNIGHNAYLWEGVSDPSVIQSILRGSWHMLPIIVTSYVVGGAWEMLFAVVRKHEINEGFLVTAMLYPLVLAPTTPLWIVALGVSFGVVIGKEVFGGVGMNILNPALTARAFVFFAYPRVISGTNVWDVVGQGSPVATAGEAISAYTGATPLLAVTGADNGSSAIDVLTAHGWSWSDMALGFIPGSMGEVSTVAIGLGALFLLIIGIASWRIMLSSVIGLFAVSGFVYLTMGGGAAGPGPDTLAIFTLPPHYHLVMGGFAFGAVFMATDPVSAASTNTGRWIYGFLIGAMCATVRIFNPAYPEGMMLSILFMNVFAPLIDYYVVAASKRRRAARLAMA